MIDPGSPEPAITYTGKIVLPPLRDSTSPFTYPP